MYAGITLYRNSGKITGVHQKIDRIARFQLNKYIPKSVRFPSIDEILHFEGNNGPDAIRIKDSSKDVPRYVVTPTDLSDREVLDELHNFIVNLSKALKNHNNERAAFEAAWMGHAIGDSLSPAHHNPMNGTFKHVMFEAGMVLFIAPSKFKITCLNDKDINQLQQKGFEAIFLESLHKIHTSKIYQEFSEKGWTINLISKTKKMLIPEIAKVLALAWYQTIILAQKS